MKGIIGVCIWVLMLLSFVGCSGLQVEEEKLVPPLVVPEQIAYKTKMVERNDIEDALLIKGDVVPIDIEYMYVTLKSTRLKSINVKLGQEVKSGDLLLELITEDLENDIKYQEINIETKRYDIEAFKKLFLLEKAMDENMMITLETPFAMNNHKSQMEIKELAYENQLKSKENSLAIEVLRLQDMRQSLEEAKLKSRINGTIVYIKDIEEGDTILDYDKLIGIADVSAIQVIYEGVDASKYTVGNEVVISYKGVDYKGSVTMTPASVPEEEKDLYPDTVYFQFEEIPRDIVRGNRVDVKLIHGSSENAVVIPKSLLLKSGADTLVYILEDGLKVERYVTTGLESGIYVEITDGLVEGETLIIN